MTDVKTIGPTCPECGKDAPLRLLVWGMGKPYDCERCGTSQVVAKAHGASLAIGAFVLWTFANSKIPSITGKTALFIGLFLAVGLISWLTMKPRRAD